MTELRFAIAVVLPYAALAVFLLGVAYRVVIWALAPVPFRIPTTCGQQKSLPWIRPAWLENPSSTAGAAARVAAEVLFFRSLLRDHRPDRCGMGPLPGGRGSERLTEPRPSGSGGTKLVYSPQRLLWAGALLFHWSLLVVLVRHLRLFLEPVPKTIVYLESLDGIFQVGVPVLYASNVALLVALGVLLARRVARADLRYLSLPADYFAPGLLLAVAGSGVLMRYFARVDIVEVRRYALGLATFSPAPPAGAGTLFYIHIALVSLLLAYFPFSKLMHMGGILLSPTRNLANTSRMKRHVNPWNPAVEVHTYEQWEDEFRGKMKAAGMPVERE